MISGIVILPVHIGYDRRDGTWKTIHNPEGMPLMELQERFPVSRSYTVIEEEYNMAWVAAERLAGELNERHAEPSAESLPDSLRDYIRQVYREKV